VISTMQILAGRYSAKPSAYPAGAKPSAYQIFFRPVAISAV